jgi:hypothetical protein
MQKHMTQKNHWEFQEHSNLPFILEETIADFKFN